MGVEWNTLNFAFHRTASMGRLQPKYLVLATRGVLLVTATHDMTRVRTL